ncbi:hypothetical protein [Streptomyces alanosinicus]|nr:hypothetical protein [Streptomyces alanosinicus]
MERDDIRAFIRHRHDAVRRECVADTEHEPLERYEASLNQTVTTRRDLGRPATNPLTCALLCALNRDRRMHLSRARKELYDAALDMLLVRRGHGAGDHPRRACPSPGTSRQCCCSGWRTG